MAEYAKSTEGEELENTVLKTYRCPYCFDISATSSKAAYKTYEISLRGAHSENGFKVMMDYSVDGQKVMSLIPCQVVK